MLEAYLFTRLQWMKSHIVHENVTILAVHKMQECECWLIILLIKWMYIHTLYTHLRIYLYSYVHICMYTHTYIHVHMFWLLPVGSFVIVSTVCGNYSLYMVIALVISPVCWNRKVFSFFLKVLIESSFLSSWGSLFQSLGAVYLKARLPYFVL